MFSISRTPFIDNSQTFRALNPRAAGARHDSPKIRSLTEARAAARAARAPREHVTHAQHTHIIKYSCYRP